MAQVIAGVYELQEKIGAGGGGVVYLGRHQRLDKQVVLKADKRTLNTSQDALRREVDLLKDLTHTYIPQVYDFVQEDGVVYTVMDYIEGESLDKMLARGELPGQPQVIKWACQLLEALVYLHGRPPHGILHGDIKPANIMVRPGGDICLIDYNIALALGEDGAVKVGFSRGYASPEHYGADYGPMDKADSTGFSSLKNHRKDKKKKSEEVTETTEVDTGVTEVDEDITVADDASQPGSGAPHPQEKETAGSVNSQGKSTTGSATEGRRAIRLDVRSDIYSLGATLYHLLSGQKPMQDAREVKALDSGSCSPAVSVILQKAMAPRPQDRYQSAEEMLEAFRSLHRMDPRAIAHRRKMLFSAAALTTLFLAGGASAFIGMKQLEQRQSALALAEYSSNALAEGDISSAVSLALQAIPTGGSILDAPVTAQAQKALTDALGVYDLSDGFKALDTINLPGAPFQITLSPEGTSLAVVYAYEAAIYDLREMRQTTVLPAQKSALSDCCFLDETHIVYAGEQGITGYDLENQTTVWTGETATTLAVSADRQTVAAVNRDEDKVIFYRTADGEKLAERSLEGQHLRVPANDIFADAQSDIFALNADGSMLAVSLQNGSLLLLNIYEPQNDLVVYEESEYQQFDGGFCGKYFAYTAENGTESQFGVIDLEQEAVIGGYTTQDHLILKTDPDGIYLASGKLLVKLDPGNLSELEMAYTDDLKIVDFSVGSGYSLVATEDGGFSFYDSGANCASVEAGKEVCEFTALSGGYAVTANRNEPSVRVLQLEKHADTQILSYDARYRHDEARISQDHKTVMFFNYEGFRICDMSGSTVTEVLLPDTEQIYDQQFRRSGDGSWLEVIWYDGTRRCYSAADGTVVSEEKGEAPSKDLYEEFITDRYRIASALHSAPEVYDRKTGKLLAVLEEDDYLTYVTQTGDYLVTEYVGTSGGRYGLLLDENFEVIASLPQLCDVNGDRFLFDYSSGDLREAEMYSLADLVKLGEAYDKR